MTNTYFKFDVKAHSYEELTTVVDWATTKPFKFIMCGTEMSKWWDIEGATKLRISLSNRPCGHAYKCKKSKRSIAHICIQDEETGKWHDYSTYTEMGHHVALMNNRYYNWYLGVQILE